MAACHAGELVSTHGVPPWGYRGGQIQPFLLSALLRPSHCHTDNLTGYCFMLDRDSKNAGQGESFIFGFAHDRSSVKRSFKQNVECN